MAGQIAARHELASQVRGFRIAEVDPKAVEYAQQLASFFMMEAEYLQHAEVFVADTAARFRRLSGMSAFVGALVSPSRAWDYIFGSGSDELRQRAKALTAESAKSDSEKELVTALRMRVRTELSQRYGKEFP